MKTIHENIRHGASKYESKYTKKYESVYTKRAAVGKVGGSAKTMFFDAKKNVGKIKAINFDKIEQKNSVDTINERLRSGDTNSLPVSEIQKKLDENISTEFHYEKDDSKVKEESPTMVQEQSNKPITADLFKKK